MYEMNNIVPVPAMGSGTAQTSAACAKVGRELPDTYENAPCGYHCVGLDGTILRINMTESTWLGFLPEELVGQQKFRAFVSACFHSEYEYAIESLRAGQHIAELEIELIRKNGEMFDALLRILAMRDGRGAFIHTHATVIDITARKRAEAEARIYAEQLQALSQHVVKVQETERRNLSAELHDRFGQDLAAINLNLHLIKDQLSAGSRTKVGARLDDSIALVERTVEGVRDLAGALRPLVLDDYGLAVTLRSYGEQFAARTGIRVSVAEAQPMLRLQPDTEMALFRISQEALTNVLKHAGATMVHLTLAVEAERISLTIADDGRGFAAESRMDHWTNGLGLLIMQERLRAVGGSLQIESLPGAGTSIMARVRRMR